MHRVDKAVHSCFSCVQLAIFLTTRTSSIILTVRVLVPLRYRYSCTAVVLVMIRYRYVVQLYEYGPTIKRYNNRRLSMQLDGLASACITVQYEYSVPYLHTTTVPVQLQLYSCTGTALYEYVPVARSSSY
eukprot:COSAG01_NODE_25_length_37050_cov_211.559119_4_plen_130_part_00